MEAMLACDTCEKISNALPATVAVIVTASLVVGSALWLLVRSCSSRHRVLASIAALASIASLLLSAKRPLIAEWLQAGSLSSPSHSARYGYGALGAL